MQRSNMEALPVVKGEEFLGMLTLDDIKHAWRLSNKKTRNNIN